MLESFPDNHTHSGDAVDSHHSNNDTVFNIDDVLNSQKNSARLSLSDRFLGDGGANYVAEFLLKHPQFTQIELRGNYLTHIGFAAICTALKKCENLRSLHLEWNTVASDSNEGLDALLSLVKVAKKLIVVDLRNNCIPSTAAPVLASIIKESKSLQFLDLRWNNITDEGAQHFLGVMKGLSRRFYLALTGNMVNEQTLSEIKSLNSEEVLRDLGTGFDQSGFQISGIEEPNARFLSDLGANGLQSQFALKRDDPLAGEKLFSPQNQFKDLTISAVHELNSQGKTLGNSKFGSNLQPDNSSPQRTNYSALFNRTSSASKPVQNKIIEPFNVNLNGGNQPSDPIEVIRQKDLLIAEQAYKIETLTQELTAKTIENETINEELKRIKSEYADNFRAMNNQSDDLVFHLTGQLSALRREFEKQSNDHNYEIKQLNKEWENKLIDYEDRILVLTRELETKNYDLESLAKSLDTIKQSYADRLKMADIHAREDEARQQKYALVVLEERYKKLEADKDHYLAKLEAATVESQNAEKCLNEERRKFDHERNRLKTDYDRVKKELDQALAEIQRLKKEIVSKEDSYSQAQKGYQGFQQEMLKLKDSHRKGIEKMQFDYNLEKQKLGDEIKDLNIRLKEAQRQIAALKNSSFYAEEKQQPKRNALDEVNSNYATRYANTYSSAYDSYRSKLESIRPNLKKLP